MNKYPRHTRDVSDLREAAKKYVLPGYVPPQPVFSRDEQVWAIGSCFAENITAELRAQGIKTAVTQLSETINSPALVLRSLSESGAKDILSHFNIAVITLGLAANEIDGQWVPSTVAEVKQELSGIVQEVREANPRIKIFFTLSPVPINRAMWSASPIIADTISKATIRAALAEFFYSKPAEVYYWPAYEIVRGLGMHRPRHFGADDNETRHVSKDVVRVVVDLFIESWFRPLS